MSQKAEETNKKRPFGMRDKLGYMFGDFGNDFSFIFAGSYLMVFYTKVLGLPGAAIGVLFLAARVVDAFTDVTMGRIVDNMRPTKDGRFRPWIKWMCIPVAVTSILMYLYFIRDWAFAWKMLYVVVTYLLWGSFSYTAINIPYGSMASAISADPGERAALSTFRSVGASLAGLVIGTLVPLVVYTKDAQGNEVVDPLRFTLTAVVFGVLSILCYGLCYVFCVERVHLERKKHHSEGIVLILTGLIKNRPLLSLVAAALVLLLANLLGQTMNNYLFLDYFHDTNGLVALNLVTVGGTLLVAPFVTRISAVFGKKEVGAWGMLAAGVVYILLFVLRLENAPVFLALLFVATLGIGLFNMVTWAFITDIIDYQEVTTGKREDGTIYAVYSFARKLGQALAGGIGGFALTAIGYISEATVQTVEVSERIYSISTLVPGICYLLVFLIMQFWYPLSRREVEKNTAILKEKREQPLIDAASEEQPKE